MNSYNRNQNGPGQAALDNTQTSKGEGNTEVDTYALAQRWLNETPFSIERSMGSVPSFIIHADWVLDSTTVSSLEEAKAVIAEAIGALNLGFDLEDVESDDRTVLEEAYRQDCIAEAHAKLERAWDEAMVE